MHFQGPLLNVDGEQPLFAQLWFYDPEFATELRCQRDTSLQPHILGQLTEMLMDVNPWIALYKTA